MARDPMSNETAASPAPDLGKVYAEVLRFREGFATLLMATVDPDGEPDASYAAYVEEGGDFYVFVSELSVHTKNLLESGRVSVLFIEEEASAGHLFARRRLTFRCRAEEIARGSIGCETILDRFEVRFGALIATLRGLQDFHLVRLRPESARYVSGFAKAFAIDDVQLAEIRHIRDKGHRAGDPATRSAFNRLLANPAEGSDV
jgi:putative heme iron utilization protein